MGRIRQILDDRKNYLLIITQLRTIKTPVCNLSAFDKKVDEMRRVHPTFYGYICPLSSMDTGAIHNIKI
jgi:DNA-directed RNA polymerase beta subunit